MRSPYYNYKKFPRKLKKKLKKVMFFNGDYNRTLWYLLPMKYKFEAFKQTYKFYGII